jgi:hypothetical protein
VNKTTWAAFGAACDRYRDYVETLRREFPRLKKLQQQLVDSRSGPPYTVESPLVYNLALDEVGPKDGIKLILVADNPGRREQATGRYLVGPSGKIAEGFFRNKPGLGIDLRKNVIILNKTPVHTPRTAELAELCRLGGPKFAEKLISTQRFMAAMLLEFHAALSGGGPAGSSTRCKPIPVWITGYSEMKRGGIFQPYTEALQEMYARDDTTHRPTAASKLRDSVLLFRHFSMNQFTVDLRKQSLPGEDTQAALDRIGRAHRQRILGW